MTTKELRDEQARVTAWTTKRLARERLAREATLECAALVDGTVAHQGDAYLNAQRIENARLRALAI